MKTIYIVTWVSTDYEWKSKLFLDEVSAIEFYHKMRGYLRERSISDLQIYHCDNVTEES